MSDTAATNADTSTKAYLMYAIWFKRPHGPAYYSEYLQSASPIAERYGARRVASLIGIEALNGTFDPDYVYFVEWPSIDSYYKFLQDPTYRAIAAQLPDAVERTYVLHCRRPDH